MWMNSCVRVFIVMAPIQFWMRSREVNMRCRLLLFALCALKISSAAADPSAGAVQLTHTGNIGVRESPTLEASASSFPLTHFSVPTHSPSLYPVYSVDSSEFLPSRRHYPSAARSIASHSSGDDRAKSVGSQPHNVGVGADEPRSSPMSSSLSRSSSDDQAPHEQSYDAPIYYPKGSKTTAIAELNPAANPTGFSNLGASGKATSSSQLEALAKSTAASLFSSPDREALDSSTLGTTAKRPLEVSSVRFQCKGRTGYFGDEDFNCKVFHFCSHDGKRFTFRCGKGLAFNEMTVSCSGSEVKQCSPALFTPTNFPPNTAKTSVDNSSPPALASKDIRVGPNYSISHDTKRAKDEAPVIKEDVGQPGSHTFTVFASHAATSGESKGKTLNSGVRNPFFDHFDKKMKGRVLGSSSFKSPESRQNEVSPEYEYVYDYEYEDEPHPIKPSKLSPFRSSSAGNTRGNDQSKTFAEFSRPSRNAHQRHEPPSRLNSVHPTGFQRFSPSYLQSANIGPTLGPIVQSTPRPVFVTTTPVYDIRLPSRRPHPSPQPAPLGQSLHPNPISPHPIPSHLIGNRNNRRPTPVVFTPRPQLRPHINNFKHTGSAGRPQPTPVPFVNNPLQFYQGSHELHPYAHPPQPTVHPYQNIPLANPSHLPLHSTGSQPVLHPFTSLRARQPVRSPVFSNSNEFTHPHFASQFHTSPAVLPVSGSSTGSNRPITTTSTQFNSVESPQVRPAHHLVDSPFLDHIGSRHPVRSPVRGSVSSGEPHVHVTTIRPRPTEVPFSLQSRIPQAGIIVTTARPFLTSINPSPQFFVGQGHSLSNDRIPVSAPTLNSALSHEDYVDDLRRPTIRFPNRELGNNDPHLRPIPTSPHSTANFHTTARSPTRTPQTRPPSRRRPASHILRQQNQPRLEPQPTADRRPLTTRDFNNHPFTNTEIHPTLNTGFPTPTPSPLLPQVVTSNGFSTTARSPLYVSHPDSNYEYEYYEDDYYDENYDSKVTHRKLPSSHLKPKPSNDYDEYYDYDDSGKKAADFNANVVHTTPRPPIIQTTKINSISNDGHRPSFDHRPLRTTTSAPATLNRRPSTRKRPRFPTRIRSRTTTPAPSNDYDYEETDFHEKSISTTTTSRPPPTTALTSKRRGIRNRLQFRNRDANNNNNSNNDNEEQTTKSPSTTKDPVVTTRRPRPALTGRAQGNSRLSALRNRLKVRAKRVKTEAERQLDEEDAAQTQNKSLDEEEHLEEETDSEIPEVDSQPSENESEKSLSENNIDHKNSEPTKEVSEDSEPEGEIKRPFRGALRKRPLDPEVRARFRKFLKNRRKKLGKLDAEAQEKSLDSLRTTTENYSATNREDNSNSYDRIYESPVRARDNYKTLQREIPVQKSMEAGGVPEDNNDHLQAERRSDIHTPTTSEENYFSKESISVSPDFVPISDPTEPSHKHTDVMSISMESYSLKDDRVQNQNELYQNQESQVVSRKTSAKSSPFQSDKHSAEEDVDKKLIAETDKQEPLESSPNRSHSEAASESPVTKLSTRFETEAETPLTTTQATTMKSTTTVSFSYTKPLVLNQEKLLSSSTHSPPKYLSTATARKSVIPSSGAQSYHNEGSHDENMQRDSVSNLRDEKLSTNSKTDIHNEKISADSKTNSHDENIRKDSKTDSHYERIPTDQKTNFSPEKISTGPKTDFHAGKIIPPSKSNFHDEEMQADSPETIDGRPKMPHRVAKPVFNFRRKFSKASERKHFISASDYEGSAEAVAPVDLVSFTMSTDPPVLPLQKLMPFQK